MIYPTITEHTRHIHFNNKINCLIYWIIIKLSFSFPDHVSSQNILNVVALWNNKIQFLHVHDLESLV